MPDGTEKPFVSIRAAGNELKIDPSNIPKVLSGKYKTACGYKFKSV